MDNFEKARERIWGTPGFQVRRSTVVSSGLMFLPDASYIVETARNDEGWVIFLQSVDQDGGRRIVVPNKVAQAIFRHYESILAHSRKERAKAAARTRATKAVKVAEQIIGERGA